MKTNVLTRLKTHEGGRARNINAEQQLRRSVMSCLLWENEFYENGESIADRIHTLARIVAPETVAQIAIEARNKMNLRHVPLWLLVSLANQRKLKKETVTEVIQRADEIGELLSLYWKNGRVPLSMALKRGIAESFLKFNEYQFAKYNRSSASIKLKDAMFLTHPRPKTAEQKELFRKLAEDSLKTPDTWEVALSAGKDKRETFERLILEKKIGGMALLRNLRNMSGVGINPSIIRQGLLSMNTDRILPFRFIAAARYAPEYEPEIEKCFFNNLKEIKLDGKTIVLVDVSGSMDAILSQRSDMKRIDAACGLAMVCREICEDVEIYSFSNDIKRIPARHGFALRDVIVSSQRHSGTYLNGALRNIQSDYDRIIVITDEQSHDSVGSPKVRGYMVNVASYKNGVGYGQWTHIDGFSESIINFISAYEIELFEN